MREIKFRAWDIEDKQMIYPLISDLATINHKKFVIQKEKFGPVRTIELMQFTGLTDRNGVEIYEGDIVKGFLKNLSGNYYEVFGSIIFAEGFGGYGVLPISQTESENSFVMIAPKLEIIGNIHEHPHLLQEELK